MRVKKNNGIITIFLICPQTKPALACVVEIGSTIHSSTYYSSCFCCKGNNDCCDLFSLVTLFRIPSFTHGHENNINPW